MELEEYIAIVKRYYNVSEDTARLLRDAYFIGRNVAMNEFYNAHYVVGKPTWRVEHSKTELESKQDTYS